MKLLNILTILILLTGNISNSKSEFINYDNFLIAVVKEEYSQNDETILQKLSYIKNIKYSKIYEGKKDMYKILHNDKNLQNYLLDTNLFDIVENDYSLELCSLNDPAYIYPTQEYAFDQIEVEKAWNYYSIGSSSIKVGIIDSGIDSNHPDLVGKVSTLSKKFTYTNTTQLNQSQLDYMEDDPYPTDNIGHGTFIAGIIGAISNNNIGISGVCKNVQLVSLKVTESSQTVAFSNVIAAINYAKTIGIPILNISLGERLSIDPETKEILNSEPKKEVFLALKDAIEDYDGLVVCAAGNDGYMNDNDRPNFPASFDCSNIISVGYSNSYDNVGYYSNIGKNTVDIFAPGENVYSIKNNDYNTAYTTGIGSSYAAPYVAATAALLLSYNSSLSTSEIKNRILSNVDQSSNYLNYCVSGGQLNVFKALHNTSHSFSYTSINQSQHKKTCNLCGYNENESHYWITSYSLRTTDTILPDGLVKVTCYYCGITKNSDWI